MRHITPYGVNYKGTHRVFFVALMLAGYNKIAEKRLIYKGVRSLYAHFER